MNLGFFSSLLNNFKHNIAKLEATSKKVNFFLIKLKKNTEEYNIEVNYGIALFDDNSKILDLYQRFKKEKDFSINKENPGKLLFIINDTNEKFTFKHISSKKQFESYLNSLTSSDFLQDIDFSVSLIIILIIII